MSMVFTHDIVKEFHESSSFLFYSAATWVLKTKYPLDMSKGKYILTIPHPIGMLALCIPTSPFRHSVHLMTPFSPKPWLDPACRSHPVGQSRPL